MKYDFLIIGAGLFGAVCARELTNKGYKCLIIEKEKMVGGMAMTDTTKGIDVHLYGPHIFHTSNERVWEFVTKYDTFIPFILNILAFNNNKLYHLPFNLNTLYELYGATWPEDLLKIMDAEKQVVNLQGEPKNLEEYALSKFGYTLYDTLIKYYTEKQWNKPCSELPKSIIERIPLRYNYDNNYFNDKYVAIPKNGYTNLIENIIGDDIDIMLNRDFFEKRTQYMKLATYIIFTGAIDEFMDYSYGALEWRSLKFIISDESEHGNNIMGTPVVNFTGKKEQWTRIIEHKWFTPWRKDNTEWQNNTILSYEYPDDWENGKRPYYPILTTTNLNKLRDYQQLAAQQYPNVLFGGRLGMYKYFDMDDTILNALEVCDKIPNKQ